MNSPFREEEILSNQTLSRGKYNTVVDRLFAGIIDALLFIPFTVIYEIVSKDSMKVEGIINLVSTILLTLYMVIGHGKYGQTLGKKVMKVKVLDIGEQNVIGYTRAFLRESVSFFISLVFALYFIFVIGDITPEEFVNNYSFPQLPVLVPIIWLVVEIITALTNSKRRAVHDYIARSVVIKLNALQKPVDLTLSKP